MLAQRRYLGFRASCCPDKNGGLRRMMISIPLGHYLLPTVLVHTTQPMTQQFEPSIWVTETTHHFFSVYNLGRTVSYKYFPMAADWLTQAVHNNGAEPSARCLVEHCFTGRDS